MLNLELCMLTSSHADHGAFHDHLRDMEAHLKTLRLTKSRWAGDLEQVGRLAFSRWAGWP